MDRLKEIVKIKENLKQLYYKKITKENSLTKAKNEQSNNIMTDNDIIFNIKLEIDNLNHKILRLQADEKSLMIKYRISFRVKLFDDIHNSHYWETKEEICFLITDCNVDPFVLEIPIVDSTFKMLHAEIIDKLQLNAYNEYSIIEIKKDKEFGVSPGVT
jgi:hypothetical protein